MSASGIMHKPLSDALEKIEKTLASKRKVQGSSLQMTLDGTEPVAGAMMGRDVEHALKIIQLPLWENQVRGLPNPLARSALFSVARQNEPRQHLKERPITSVKGVEIFYTGEELRQDDEDVFLNLVHLARSQPLGHEVSFTAYSMLKSMGWPTSSPSYERLRLCILRLTANAVEIRFDAGSGKRGYGGTLVQEFTFKDETDRQWKVRLNPKLITLFGADAYTQLDWRQRLKLRSPLAKWLHGFYFTHREPFGYKVETLKGLCGSSAQQLYHFRNGLKKALALLVEQGFLKSWKIDPVTDVVTVVRASRSASAALLMD
ncbi:plasmid replication initiator TrfA [Oxalobacteraceae bacterium R-40]|uniref:Plasmid replication initiator TrfA n=1 Tax=Keguizhuia sedimenti TaxID=3064264 RepID=A0ABU1BKK7_9BURK|nr:plasmid replication initiator TrfA [Oxalobacteraceae bacterium R-40]